MSQPLQSPWVDTGITASYTTSVDLSVLKAGIFLPPDSSDGNWLSASGQFYGPWILQGSDDGSQHPPGTWHHQEVAKLWLPDGVTNFTLENTDTTFSSPTLFTYNFSSAYSFTESSGPFRLGVRYHLIQPPYATPHGAPNFGAVDYELEFAWFADEFTSVTQSVAGHSVTMYPLTGTTSAPSAGATPVNVGPILGILYLRARVEGDTLGFAAVGVGCRFRAIRVNGAAPDGVLNLDNGVLKGVLSDGIDGYADGYSNQEGAAPPFVFTYEGRVSQNGTTADNWARLIDYYLTRAGNAGQAAVKSYLTFPADNGGYSAPIATWKTDGHNLSPVPTLPSKTAGVLRFELDPTWEAAQDPALSDSDHYVPIRGAKLSDPSARLPYLPVKLQFAASVDVFRPNTLRPSDFVGLDGNCVVTEHATTTDFLVSGATAGAKRTLLSTWRNKVTVGDPLYTLHGYRLLKRPSGEDVFWWATYTWLKMTWNAPAGFTLSVKIDFTHLEVPSPGATPYTEHAGSATYSVPILAGTHDYHLDLILPGGVETYIGRVDAITLSGFPVNGTPFVLSALTLEARDDAYVKHAMGVPANGGDYSVPVLSIAGSWAFGSLPDPRNKADEDNPDAYGGSPRYVYPGADQALLVDYWAAAEVVGLDQIEGITVSYDSTVSDAAIKDAFNVRLAPENADWIEPTVPSVRLAAATDWQPNVTPCCRQIQITNLQSYLAHVDHPLWGGIETVVKNGAARAAAGANLVARRTDTGATAGAGSTDAFGYTEVSPVPANGVLDWELVQA